jgi:hypothetical protein
VRLICEGVAPIKSKMGEAGMVSSFGLTRPAAVSFCWLIKLLAKNKHNNKQPEYFLIK